MFLHIFVFLNFWFCEKKRFADFFGSLKYQKNKFFKNFFTEEFHKKVKFCTRRCKSHFFWLTLYANISFLFKIKNVIKYLPHIIFIYTEHFLCILNQKSCLMINNSNLIPWLGIKWNMATIYSIHYIPKFVFLENVCRVLLHPLPIRHVYHLVLQCVDSINDLF